MVFQESKIVLQKDKQLTDCLLKVNLNCNDKTQESQEIVMSSQQVHEFFKLANQNEALTDRLQLSKDSESILRISKEYDYGFTEQELLACEQEKLQESWVKNDELSEHQSAKYIQFDLRKVKDMLLSISKKLSVALVLISMSASVAFADPASFSNKEQPNPNLTATVNPQTRQRTNNQIANPKKPQRIGVECCTTFSTAEGTTGCASYDTEDGECPFNLFKAIPKKED